MRKNQDLEGRKKKLVLHQETLRRLDLQDLRPVVGGASAASVCHENTKPECYSSIDDCPPN